MRIEEKMKRDQAKRGARGKPFDQTYIEGARGLAQEVLNCLNNFSGDLPTGEATTEGERLAASLIFLRSLTIEYVNRVYDHAQIAEQELPRFRVAQDALGILNDIARKRRGPIHQFFAGCAESLKSRAPTSREMSVDCRVMACLRLMLDVGKAGGLTREKAIERIMDRPGIAAHISDPKHLDYVQYGLPKNDPAYQELIADWTSIIEFGCGLVGLNVERILSFTEASLDKLDDPLSFDAAARTMRQGVAVRTPDGRLAALRPQPHPMPLLAPRRALPSPLMKNAKG